MYKSKRLERPMTPYLQAMSGLIMIAIGGLKTWLHMGTVPVLSLPTCSGKTFTLAIQHTGRLEQAHCWGCYMIVAGLAVALLAVYRDVQKRRSVAYGMD